MESDPFKDLSKETVNEINRMSKVIKEAVNLERIYNESKAKTGQGEYIFNLLKGWEEN
jgi:hypothetical protein